MARIFITGSSDRLGLGIRSARALIKRGHDVYLHARNSQRAQDARTACPGAKDVFVADLASVEGTKSLAKQLNQTGPWDAIAHNAAHPRLAQGVTNPKNKDGIPVLFVVNTLAPYILTSLVNPPAKRYVFVSSGMHKGGDPSLLNIQQCNYSDSKLHNVLLSFWFARRLADRGVLSNAMSPGWVATRMGGSSAPDDIDAAVDTYVLLAEGSGVAEGETGKYWYQTQARSSSGTGHETSYLKELDDEDLQDQLIETLEKISGVKPPEYFTNWDID
ncbi:putative short chain dehydrogenase [Daldinia vernicosa]|uniref:putative short chain dehydrogenase n=1 Tax=Daldinia vernicosa TaxID=114800 RepID=UPI002007627E|nr:putative short chain dehydrogenase [Daldinia vernicosa]KAI0853907.1 putative short chain dehydrogenase [Daldinia vernicosa]